MNGRQEEWIISGSDDQDEAHGHAVHCESNALHPKRPPFAAGMSRREDAGGIFLQPTASVRQRQNFRNELFRDRPIAHGGGSLRETIALRGESMAKSSG